MSDEAELGKLLPRSVRSVPADLALVVAASVAAAVVALVPGLRGTGLALLLGVPFAVLLPGYALVAALFPARSDRDSTVRGGNELLVSRFSSGIRWRERAMLSVGTSVLITPFLAYLLNFTPWGIERGSVLAAVSLFTVVASALAAANRAQLAPSERLRTPFGRWAESLRAEFLDHDTTTDKVLNVAIVVALLAIVGSGAYALTVSSGGETFTEFYLLAENESGELGTQAVPERLRPGANQTLVVGVGNHESEVVNYTVVARVQRIDSSGNATRVVRQRRVERFSARLGPNETARHRHTVTPSMRGEVRLQYLLYRGEPPANPSAANAYHTVHAWLTVAEGNGSAAESGSAAENGTDTESVALPRRPRSAPS